MPRVLLALVVLALIPCPRAVAADRPNIVFILADDVGIEALGCYGGESYETPRLDALAKSGTRFDYGFSMAVCHPTRVCFLTGQYPFRLGHPRWGSFPKSAEEATIASVLKKAGYATAVAGKWQLTLLKNDLDHPHRLGFDDYCLFGWHEGPRYFQPLIWQNGERRTDVEDRYGPDVYVDFLADFVKRHRDEPFFCFYSMALCHDVTDDLKEPVPFGPDGRYESYREMAEQMDREVGRVVDAIEDLGLRERTLIVFTGDNGTSKSSILSANEKGQLKRVPVDTRFRGTTVRGGKGDLTDGGTNVPLIASWPGTVGAGRVVDDLVDMSDYFATFADLAGAKVDWTVDGRSFAPRLRSDEPGPRRWAFAEHRGKSWVRDQHHKLYSDGRFVEVLGRARPEREIDETTPSERATRTSLEKAMASLRKPER